ncbi:MAG: CHAT domain-containing protein [Phycisphaerae bacterium]|nr:CHAT domain-containing protein [Gemmatimonadaceae bacterium]
MRLALIVATSIAAHLALQSPAPGRSASSRPSGSARADAPPADSAEPRTINASALAAANALRLSAWTTPWNERRRRAPNDRTALYAIATAARLGYKLDQSDSLYARIARTGSDGLRRQALLWRAHIAATGGRYMNADSLFRSVEKEARRANDTLTALDAILAYSGTSMRTLGANAAIAILAAGDSLGWKREPALDAAARCRESTIQSRLGNRDRARSTAREGIAIAARAGLPRLEAACLFALATEFARTGQTDSLRNPLQTVMATQERIGDLAGLAASKQWAGYYLTALGKIPEAQRNLATAWNASQRAGTVSTSAWIALNNAGVAQQFYDAASNSEWIDRADALMRQVDDLAGKVEVLMMQATRAQRAGDFATAERHVRAAHSAADRLGEPNAHFSITSVRFELAMQQSRIEEAAAISAERRVLVDKYKFTGYNGSLLSDDAEIEVRRGNADKALPIVNRALANLHPTQRRFIFASEELRALALAMQGNTRAAASAALAAAETFDKWRASLNDRSLQTLSVQSRRSQGWFSSTLVSTLAANGEVEVAFALAERRRARDLRDRLALAASWNTSAAASADSSVQSVMTVSDIQRALPDQQTALVMMDAGEDGARGTAFVLTRESLTAHTIPSVSEIAPRIRRLVASLESGRDASTESRALGAALIAPLLNRLDSARIARIVFLPEGVLHRLPMDVLKLPDGRYLVERFETAVAPSATVLAKLATYTTPTRAGRALALADARVVRNNVSDSTTDTRTFSSLFRTAAFMPRLGGARNEVASVRRNIPATDVRTGASATEHEVKRSAATYDVLHFATHAVVDEWSGSSAALALTAGDGDDGLFDSSEIARLRLSASLVVLSACRTIGGEVIAGEGVRGLTGAFLQAGARSVIATAWRVNDREVVPVVTTLYEQLARHRTVGTALRDAKLAAIKRNVAPSVWGAFTLVGDPWRVVVGAPASSSLRN